MGPMSDELEDVRNQFPGLAQEAFPDDVDIDWRVREITHKARYYCVEAEPHPATVGYPLFRFVLVRGNSDSFLDVGCYCLDGGTWQLLYTTPETTSDWKALGFDSA